ncbi:MAG: cytochrome ubiquinol oxidase subunit I [Armatimonadota bacterium]|nr:cytochrome ubiquinol oxidase subunit I [bacterium]MDW8289170.1 cytochrome ubiquinol oxidase subunit I [Armatimonadota bacterium]
MEYPFWDVPLLGGGMLIGIIAILHVFVAHFAIGSGLFLVLSEIRARRTGDEALLGYLKRHSTFFILVALVFGAISGVGIWWAIGLVHPSATSALIHIFVWAWAIEWVFFIVELLAAFIYYYGWNRLDPRTHIRVGWIYLAGAWLSLFMINGILTFMLTPGKWVETRSIVDAFFNPSMLPSLVVRTAVAVALAGLYALITASAEADESLRERVVKYASKWVLVGMTVIPIGGIWYISRIPDQAREISMGGAPVVTLFAAASVVFSAFVFLATLAGPFLFPRRFHVTFAFVIVALGLVTTGVTEWVREAVRKPYIIYDYMYSNAVRTEDVQNVWERGVLASAKWSLLDEQDKQDLLRMGEKVFRFHCQSCHTVNGFNGIKFAVKGWKKDFIDMQLQNLDQLKGYMPPFLGTEEERKALTEWLYSLNNPVEVQQAASR